MEKDIISAAQAARLIRQGDTLIIGGSGGIGVAEKVLEALESRFLSDREPGNLTLKSLFNQCSNKCQSHVVCR